MQAETWQRVSTIVSEALERPAGERQHFLDEICADEPEIRREAEALLAFDTQTLDAEDRPVFQLFTPSGLPGSPRSAARPNRVGPYEIVDELGRGGMSDVYLARRHDGLPPSEVAVKVLKQGLEADDGSLRLYQEGEILGRLRHSHIAAVHGGGLTEDGRPFLIIERVIGSPIDEHCRHHRVDLEGRLRLFLDICDAVAFAHRKLVVHRDLKPSNILVSADSETKLLDFGISKWLGPKTQGASPVTLTGLQVMTPEYASPEQVRGEPAAIASDIYALGVILFQLLTGRRPFLPSSVESLLHKICFQEAPWASGAMSQESWRDLGPPPGQGLESWRRRLGGDLDTIIAMALRKEPEHRYASVPDLADDIRNYLELRPVAARSGSALYRTTKALRRHRWIIGLLLLFFVVVASLLIDRFGVYQRWQRESQRAIATQEFLLELFAHADPDSGQDSELTVREVLGKGVERIDRLRNEPLLQGHLLTTVGHIYANLGRGLEAQDLARRSLALHLEKAGAESRETADSHRLLGRVLSEAGLFEEADRHLRRAIELYETKNPAPRPQAEAMATLAFNLQQEGDSEQALSMVQACLELCRREGLEETSEMAVALNNLGFIHHGRGDFDQAITFLGQALELNRKIHGEDHPMVALALSNLGAIAIMNGDTDVALRHLEDAYQIWQRTTGDEDRLALTNRYNKAALLFNIDRFEEAAQTLEELLPRMVKILGEKHPLLPDGFILLAKSLAAQNIEVARVSELRRQALDLCREIYDEGHPKIGEALYQMALDIQHEEPEQALAWLQETLEIELLHLGPESEQVAETRAFIAELSAR